MRIRLHLGIVLATLVVSTAARAAEDRLPPISTTELDCPAGARVILLIEETRGLLQVYVDNKYAFLVDPILQQPSSPAIVVAKPDGYVSVRPLATMDLGPLATSAEPRVHVRAVPSNQSAGGARLRGYIGCDRWQAAISDEEGARYGDHYEHLYTLKRAAVTNVHNGDVSAASAPAAAALPASPHTVELTRTVAAGRKLQIDFLYSINPDCTSIGLPTVRLAEQPQHGAIAVENGSGFTNFPQNNPRVECNRKRSDGVTVAYEPAEGYTGMDSITLDVIYASGTESKRHYAIEVK